MIDFVVYKWVHLMGLTLLIFALGESFIFLKTGGETIQNARKSMAVFHGAGLFFLLVGGFGMLARLGLHSPWPGWVWLKLAIWLIAGVSLALIKRRKVSSAWVFGFALLLVAIGGYLALWKPF